MSSLYIDHFGLGKSPFQITPDPDFFFSGGRRGDVLAALLHVAAHDEGIMTLVAEIGSGKTLLARLMISRLDPQICAVYLANPCFSRDEIIAAIGRDLGLTDLPDSKESKLAALQQELLRRHALGQRVLLVIDEAHAMPMESLEEVRLLSNLETGQHKLINIMLFGQPELDVLLAEPRLRQVRDRVIHRFELQALQSIETSAYVDHRLRTAGWQGAALFSSAAMERLIKAAQGRARRINLLADKALLAAYAQGAMTVELAHVNQAMHELPMDTLVTKGLPKSQHWPLLGMSLGLSVLLSAAAVGLLGWYRSAPPTSVVSQAPQVSPSAQISAVVPALPVATPAATPVVAPIAATVALPAAIPTSTPVTATDASANTPSAAPILLAEKAGPVPAPAAQSHSMAPQQAVPGLSPNLPSVNERARAIFERTKVRLSQTPLSGYTIQLVAMESVESLDRYLTQITPQLESVPIYGQFSDYKGKTYMAVYVGDFATALDCARAIEALPLAVRGNRPLVRSWVKVKQEQTP